MKYITFLLLLVISPFFISCQGDSTIKKDNLTTNKPNQIEVIDFYGTHRCVSCKAIEANTKYTIDTYFADESKVVFKLINVDEDINYELAERFEAIGTALFLNVIKDGKETHIDLTEFGFSKGQDKSQFVEGLKAKIETELKHI